MSPEILTLYRKWYGKKTTCGELVHNNTRIAWTLEDVVRPVGVKVYGETAIPAGRYLLELTMSNRFKRILPAIQNVKDFEGIRIHRGNTDKDTHGCILVGNKISEGYDYIWESAKAEADVIKYIKDHNITHIHVIDTKAT